MERCLKTAACLLVLIFAPLSIFGQPFGLRVLNAETTVKIPLAWNQDQPEGVSYYSIYVSTVQGQFDKPYARITKLPTAASPVVMEFPADGAQRFMVIRVVGAEGESGNSNQITFIPSCPWSDLQ